MVNRKALSALLTGAAVASAQCTIPTEPLSTTITYPFRAQVQNASRLEVHNQYLNLLEAGGGDRHLFIGPVGTPTYDLTLVDGVINHVPDGVRAVIGGEFSEIDHTTKMFMTGRGDPRAVFAPTYACNPDTDELQIELQFVTWQNQPAGGHICVRSTFDAAHEFRYNPPGNELIDVDRECIKVTLVVIPSDGIPIPATTLSTVTVSATSTVAIPSSTHAPGETFADLTASGWSFQGCSPEERWANDGSFRTLSATMTGSDTMTNEACMAFCTTQGYAFAGTEWSRECWCGNSYAATRQPATTLASLASCNFKCSGDANSNCGGDSWLSLYAKCPTEGPCENVVFV